MSEFLTSPELHALVLGPNSLEIEFGASHPSVGGGIYALFADDGLLLYIGKSLHVFNRVSQHYWAYRRGERSKFTSWSAIDVPTNLMGIVETAHIQALNPPENSLVDRCEHPQYAELVELIQKEWGAA